MPELLKEITFPVIFIILFVSNVIFVLLPSRFLELGYSVCHFFLAFLCAMDYLINSDIVKKKKTVK